MIDILTRVRHQDLYAVMKESARQTAAGQVRFIYESDDGQPRLAESYNRMVKHVKSDIVVLCHDDAIFLQDGWDQALLDVFADKSVNVAGVVGSVDYRGGEMFRGGSATFRGAYVANVDEGVMVKLFSGHESTTPVDLVDSFFFAARRDVLDATPFDEQFDGLFFYDMDFMLRAGGVHVAPILMAHYKPDHLRGVYPKDLKPMGDYWDKFHAKHGYTDIPQIGNPAVAAIPMATLRELGRKAAYKRFADKFLVAK